jgi:ferrous iron transport protein A
MSNQQHHQEKERSMTMLALKDGDQFHVRRVTIPREIGKRLADMGFVRGARGTIVRSALLGDPIQVRICRYDVAIRRAEARGIEVDLVLSDKAGVT